LNPSVTRRFRATCRGWLQCCWIDDIVRPTPFSWSSTARSVRQVQFHSVPVTRAGLSDDGVQHVRQHGIRRAGRCRCRSIRLQSEGELPCRPRPQSNTWHVSWYQLRQPVAKGAACRVCLALSSAGWLALRSVCSLVQVPPHLPTHSTHAHLLPLLGGPSGLIFSKWNGCGAPVRLIFWHCFVRGAQESSSGTSSSS
jgi:hypothetical protein